MSNKNLIVYYSHSGNTAKIAELIQQTVKGTLYEIQPKTPYPAEYNAVVNQAKKEILAGYQPPLKNNIQNLDLYDTVFVGTPNWWSTVAPPIVSFLTENNMAGKTIIPFCTHGGGGLARVAEDIAKLCPNSNIKDSFDIYGSGGIKARAAIDAWIKKIGL